MLVWRQDDCAAVQIDMLPTEIRDLAAVQRMRVREVADEAERARLWAVAVAAFPPYAEYQAKTTRRIPVFVAEPAR